MNPEKIVIRLGAELPTLLRQARDRYNHANLLEVFEAEPELAEWAFANKVQVSMHRMLLDVPPRRRLRRDYRCRNLPPFPPGDCPSTAGHRLFAWLYRSHA